MTTQIKFYCEKCEKHQSAEIEPAIIDKERPQLEVSEEPWGDIVCNVCGLVIATYSAEHEGKLEFVWQDYEGFAREVADREAYALEWANMQLSNMPQDE